MRKIVMMGAAAVVVVASMSMPANAVANSVVAVPGSFAAGFATTTVVVSKAAPAYFVNLDVDNHDVVSKDRKPNGDRKFESEIIGLGEYSEIAGLASLAPGDYDFLCSIHTNMTGTITLV